MKKSNYICYNCEKKFNFDKAQELNLLCNRVGCIGVLNEMFSGVKINQSFEELSKSKLDTSTKEILNSRKTSNHKKSKSNIQDIDHSNDDVKQQKRDFKHSQTIDSVKKSNKKEKIRTEKVLSDIYYLDLENHLILIGYSKNESRKIIDTYLQEKNLSFFDGSFTKNAFEIFKSSIKQTNFPNSSRNTINTENQNKKTTRKQTEKKDRAENLSKIQYQHLEHHLRSKGFNDTESKKIIAQYLKYYKLSFFDGSFTKNAFEIFKSSIKQSSSYKSNKKEHRTENLKNKDYSMEYLESILNQIIPKSWVEKRKEFKKIILEGEIKKKDINVKLQLLKDDFIKIKKREDEAKALLKKNENFREKYIYRFDFLNHIKKHNKSKYTPEDILHAFWIKTGRQSTFKFKAENILRSWLNDFENQRMYDFRYEWLKDQLVEVETQKKSKKIIYDKDKEYVDRIDFLNHITRHNTSKYTAEEILYKFYQITGEKDWFRYNSEKILMCWLRDFEYERNGRDNYKWLFDKYREIQRAEYERINKPKTFLDYLDDFIEGIERVFDEFGILIFLLIVITLLLYYFL